MTKHFSCKLYTAVFVFFFILPGTVALKAQVRSIVEQRQSKVEIKLEQGGSYPLETNGIDTTLGSRILAAMNSAFAKTLYFNMHGVSASVIVPGLQQWSGTVGVSYGSVLMDTTLLCEAGSITKTFVTALIMRLQDQGKLSIKDSIYKWLPRHYPNVDSGITIEMLLNHSSGVYDYINDDTNQTVLYNQYKTDPSKVWTADSILLNYVFAPNFKPGKDYRYSNTNFVLLGIIAEKAGGAPLRDQIHSNFIDPLKLSNTFFGGRDSITQQFAHNWSAADSKYPSTDLTFIDKTAQLTGSPGDGNICSTPSDLVRWVRALYIGNVVSSNAIKQMEIMHHWSDGSYYGLGTQLAPYYSHTFYGHSGGMVGFKSAMFANPKDSVCVAVYVNWDPDPTVTDIYLNDYLIAILNEIYKPVSSVTSKIGEQQAIVSVYPNPASEITTVRFYLERECSVKLTLYNSLGTELLESKTQPYNQGQNELTIDVSKLHSGIYFYSLQSAVKIETGKLIVK